nr:MAG TPA: hypothetical protein [Caudoviricetes sp.]
MSEGAARQSLSISYSSSVSSSAREGFSFMSVSPQRYSGVVPRISAI